jgi:CsoR family transcriptional regulator, copper-sensing transcriptional repressor
MEKFIPRINKIAGQLNGIKKMIEEQRYCPEIITQIKAVNSACQSLEIVILEKHLESCVMEAFHSKDKKLKQKKLKSYRFYTRGQIDDG